jgi:rod shape determining protein RodA
MIRRKFRFDWVILVIIIFLTGLSLLTLSVIDRESFTNQIINALVGFLGFLFFAAFPYKLLKRFTLPIAVFSLIILALPLALGTLIRGASRWITIGSFALQPSELIKPLIIAIIASQGSIFLSLATIAPFFLLIFFQPDLGSSLVLLSGWAGINFHKKTTRRYLIILSTLALICLPLVWSSLAPFQKERITSFLNPESDPRGSNYQSRQAIISVGSGQIIGRGLGLGSQSRLAFLPERHNDLLFASFVEAFGFLGGMSIIVAYFILFWRLFRLAEKSTDSFGQSFIIGTSLLLSFQTIVNIGMNIGLLPITGLTLPLFSYGGSSYLSSMIFLGITEAIASQQTFSKTEELIIR